MVLSKPLEKTYETKIKNVGNYDFLDDWDTCDYIDPTNCLLVKMIMTF